MEGGNLATLIAGFDQEAAAVIVARLATHKMEAEEDFDATRWLDRTLIRLAHRPQDTCSMVNEQCACQMLSGATKLVFFKWRLPLIMRCPCVEGRGGWWRARAGVR